MQNVFFLFPEAKKKGDYTLDAKSVNLLLFIKQVEIQQTAPVMTAC